MKDVNNFGYFDEELVDEFYGNEESKDFLESFQINEKSNLNYSEYSFRKLFKF